MGNYLVAALAGDHEAGIEHWTLILAWATFTLAAVGIWQGFVMRGHSKHLNELAKETRRLAEYSAESLNIQFSEKLNVECNVSHPGQIGLMLANAGTGPVAKVRVSVRLGTALAGQPNGPLIDHRLIGDRLPANPRSALAIDAPGVGEEFSRVFVEVIYVGRFGRNVLRRSYEYDPSRVNLFEVGTMWSQQLGPSAAVGGWRAWFAALFSRGSA